MGNKHNYSVEYEAALGTSTHSGKSTFYFPGGTDNEKVVAAVTTINNAYKKAYPASIIPPFIKHYLIEKIK